MTCFSWNYSTFFNTTQKTGQDFPHVPEVGPPKSVVFIWLTLPVPVNKVGWYNWRGASFSGLCVIVAENNSFCKGSWMAAKLAAVWAPAGCLIVCRLQDNGLKKETNYLIHSRCMPAKPVIWQGLDRVINGKQRSCQFNFIAKMSKDWGCLNFPNIRMRGLREKILLGWQDKNNLSIIYPVKSHPFSTPLAPKIYLSPSNRVSYNAFPPNLYRHKITRLSCITWTNFSAH